MLLHRKDAFAYVASASLAERNDLLGNFLGGCNVVAVVEPLLGKSLDFGRALVAFKSCLHVGCYAALKLLMSD